VVVLAMRGEVNKNLGAKKRCHWEFMKGLNTWEWKLKVCLGGEFATGEFCFSWEIRRSGR
jgi:hypothetical protein